jgi:glycosyltransferase involved in cell wall biosynthesis
MSPVYSSSHSYFITPIKNSNRIDISIRSIETQVSDINKPILFMDDDLLDFNALRSIPFSYAFRLWIKTLSKKSLAFKHYKLWISTPYLAEKYQAYNPRLLRPVASGELLLRHWEVHYKNPNNIPVRICYHGTWSHRDDIKWLVPIIAEVQDRCSNTIFEIIGGNRVGRLFRGIPRVVVLDAMKWPDYLVHTQTNRQDIGLAPLLDTLFNRARGPIKFFDYARCGAVGVYSKSNAFNDFVSHGHDGYLLDNTPELWIETIVSLVNSPEKRASMSDAAWQKVLDNSTASEEIQQYLNTF